MSIKINKEYPKRGLVLMFPFPFPVELPCYTSCHLLALDNGVSQQTGDKVLTFAFPDQVWILNIFMTSLEL